MYNCYFNLVISVTRSSLNMDDIRLFRLSAKYGIYIRVVIKLPLAFVLKTGCAQTKTGDRITCSVSQIVSVRLNVIITPGSPFRLPARRDTSRCTGISIDTVRRVLSDTKSLGDRVY
jgi:hypothetical protein